MLDGRGGNRKLHIRENFVQRTKEFGFVECMFIKISSLICWSVCNDPLTLGQVFFPWISIALAVYLLKERIHGNSSHQFPPRAHRLFREHML